MSSKHSSINIKKELSSLDFIILSELLLLKTLQNANSRGLTKEQIIEQLKERIKIAKQLNPNFRIQWPAGRDLSGELFKFKELQFIDNDIVDNKIIWKAKEKEHERGKYYLDVWLSESKEREDIPDFESLFQFQPA